VRRLVTVLGFPILLVVGVLLLGACTSESPAVPDDPQLQLGAELYATRCAGCHGQTGGGGSGVKLAGRVEEVYPDIADQMAVIANGKGSMPAFAGALTPDQIEAIAKYEREVL